MKDRSLRGEATTGLSTKPAGEDQGDAGDSTESLLCTRLPQAELPFLHISMEIYTCLR